MSERRRMLMAIANTGVWLPYSFEYLYHDLIPTTIDSKQVKNKLKLATIYGNSVVENQLVQNGNFESSSNWSISGATWVASNNEAFITLGSGSIAFQFYQSITKTTNHYYLIKAKVKADTTISNMILYWGNTIATTSLSTAYKEINVIISNVGGNNNLNFAINTADIIQNAKIYIKEVQLIDLTQMFPFDTPTTLTDNRVQAILNRGYIPFNSGEIKSVDIGEFSSEPYNLFDEVWEGGSLIQADGTEYPGQNAIRSDYIKVQPSQTYSFEWNTDLAPNEAYFFYYDKNKNYITYKYFSSVGNAQIPNNCEYIRLEFIKYNSGWATNIPTNLQTCVHRTGTRTGYAPHTSPQTISFKYQGGGVGTSHNTMEIGKENVVFTKDRALVDLGTIPENRWSINTSAPNGTNFYCSPSVNGLNIKSISTSEQPNALCSNYACVKHTQIDSGADKSMSITGGTNSYGICIRDTSLGSTPTQAQIVIAMSNVMLEYQLATPQVITIPRKHLGVVDLGSLTYTSSGNGYFTAKITNQQVYEVNSNINRMYCSQYLTYSNADRTSNTRGINLGYTGDTSWTIRFKDESISTINATLIQQALSGIYLFYETQDEVADIVDTIGVEAGGTFTANWFSWVENNSLKSYLSPNPTIQDDLTFTRNTNTQSITINGTASATTQRGFGGSNPLTANRYYLAYCDKPNGQFSLIDGNASFTSDFKAGKIAHPTSNVNFSPRFDITSGTSFNNLEVNIMLVDLTLAFGSGNEPTSVSDPRIQYIINQGYIPTNTTGTYKHVDYEVLTDVDTKIKGK